MLVLLHQDIQVEVEVKVLEDQCQEDQVLVKERVLFHKKYLNKSNLPIKYNIKFKSLCYYFVVFVFN